jgi:predicted dehydrogenase
MRKVRLGILGASWWSDVVWQGFSRAQNTEVTWIASRTAEKAEAFARQNGIPNWTGNYKELIAAPDVDAVFVGVPNHLHEEMAIAALAHGKHVFQEKPMALTTERAVAQEQVAKSRGLVLGVNQELRLADGLADLPAYLRDNLGALRKVTIGLSLAPSRWDGWRGDPALSGGTLFEMIIHELDVARWLLGRDPVSVFAHGSDAPGEDLTVVLDFGQGDSAVIDVCWRTIGFGLRIDCACERGRLRREVELPEGAGHQVVVTESGREVSEFTAAVQGGETFKRMLEGFSNAILTGGAPPVPASDGVWAVRMAEAARQSLREQKVVPFHIVI